ncbi:MAG: hypothetical protein CME61_03085 [Halobacteriovoraceae bacterium]|nr:hypothetical protein [Halobacteriovoraceae bacterium]
MLSVESFTQVLIKKKVFDFKEVIKKRDGTFVTDLDLEINNLFFKFKEKMGYEDNVISEETGDESILTIPSFVIDPVDGTNGLILGNGEWSVSLARLKSWRISSSENEGVIYQPTSGIIFDINSTKEPLAIEDKIRILVSRSEYEKGFFSNIVSKDVELVPMGSIALKLAYLASGKCDGIITLRKKSIWDIAAGLVLLSRTQKHFFSDHTGRDILNFNNDILYNPPLIFGTKSAKQRLIELTNKCLN